MATSETERQTLRARQEADPRPIIEQRAADRAESREFAARGESASARRLREESARRDAEWLAGDRKDCRSCGVRLVRRERTWCGECRDAIGG